MKSKTKIFLSFFILCSLLLVIEVIYLQTSDLKEGDNRLKREDLKLIALPNLAISSDTLSLRNKSYTNIFEIFSNDGELQSNSKMSFVY